MLSYHYTEEETEGQRGERTWPGCHRSEVVSSDSDPGHLVPEPTLEILSLPHHMCVQRDYPNHFPLGIQRASWDLTCEVGGGQGTRQPLNTQRPSEELLFSATVWVQTPLQGSPTQEGLRDSGGSLLGAILQAVAGV